MVHIPGRTNPADFLTRKRFPSGSGPADSTGYDDPDCVHELFTLSAPPSAPGQVFVQMATPDAPRFLDPTFSGALLAALPSDPLLSPLEIGRAHV